jgi:hypothetical protein
VNDRKFFLGLLGISLAVTTSFGVAPSHAQSVSGSQSATSGANPSASANSSASGSGNLSSSSGSGITIISPTSNEARGQSQAAAGPLSGNGRASSGYQVPSTATPTGTVVGSGTTNGGGGFANLNGLGPNGRGTVNSSSDSTRAGNTTTSSYSGTLNPAPAARLGGRFRFR